MRTDMDQWTEIRRRVLVEGASRRSICREYHLSPKTLKKILAHSEPPGYRIASPRPKPKLDGFLPVIDEILEADKTAPPKQRHTGRRIFERLRDEYDYTGGMTQVQEAVARARLHQKEVFVPISHPPGRAQFDFGEATVRIAGVECKAALAVMTMPYCDGYFVSAYPRECTETFHAGHLAGYEFFGGVPTRTDYEYVPRNIFVDHHGEYPAEEPPCRLEAADVLFGALEERRPAELMAAEARREDEPVAHAAAVPVRYQPEPAEVHLQLGPRRWVVDAHGRRPPSCPTALHREACQRAVWDHHAFAFEEDPDLDDGEPVLHPLGDLLLLGEQ
ncbi:MAG: hypothetical protein ACRDYB_13235 [Acidimicrobiales bacterium]